MRTEHSRIEKKLQVNVIISFDIYRKKRRENQKQVTTHAKRAVTQKPDEKFYLKLYFIYISIINVIV